VAGVRGSEQLGEVAGGVGDQDLASQRDQFPDPAVAVRELGQQPPPQRMGGRLHERRDGRTAGRDDTTSATTHQTG
jgi:hypothetical protein